MLEKPVDLFFTMKDILVRTYENNHRGETLFSYEIGVSLYKQFGKSYADILER